MEMHLYIYEKIIIKLVFLLHGKNDFVERFQILLDIDLKIILLDHQNNFMVLKNKSNAVFKNFDILATNLNVTFYIIILTHLRLAIIGRAELQGSAICVYVCEYKKYYFSI